MHNNTNYQCKICWNKALTFGVGSIQLSFRIYHCVRSPNTCKYVFNPNVTTFQSNCAEGLHFSAFIVNIFKKGDRENPGNYRGITLLSVVGKVFCKILNNRLVPCLDKEGALHEGQAGFRLNRGCMDNVYTLYEVVQGRLREDKETYLFRYTESL